jgi:hypothetical protein
VTSLTSNFSISGMNLNSPFSKFLFAAMLVLGIATSTYATHLRAGEITVERVSCNSLTFRITVTVFTNTINTSVLFGGEDDWLDFGDGSRPRLVPETPNTLRPDLGEGIATASYTIEYTYPGFGEYTISYSEPNRNEGVVNMDISVNTRFYIETKIVVDPFFGCNNTPKLLVPPIDRACTGATWFHNPGAYDPDGDSISYELVIPFRAEDQTVINYKDPSDPKFYTNYDIGNEAATGKPSFSINAADGTLTWDAPGMAGEYNIAFIVKEWRQIDGKWYSNGFVRRDMQIIVDDCDNNRPDLIVPEDVCVEAGTILNETIFGIDPDKDPVKIEAFSEIFQFPPAQSPATWKPNDGVFRPSSPPYELKFSWQTKCEHVKEQPYQVVFKITDNSKEGVNLVTFKTWNIRVVGPPPKWASATVDLQTRVSTVKWDPYFCQNAETMQIWRRVDSFVFEPDSCQTGMPEFLGYEMIATVPVKTTNQFIDNNKGAGLSSGAQYCYRLVAIYPKPKGGESYVSKEICLDPILADEPVITNVSIERTAATSGKILVRWTPPFDINKTQFPEPYQYEVYRAEGFAGNANLTRVHPGLLSDTVFVDEEQNLNTRDITYNYRIILWSKSATNPVFAKIDTSSTASTVRLNAQSDLKQIQLNWSAFVPWSNIILTSPNQHLLFRGPEGSNETQLQLIAQIDPTTGGMTYLDQGQHNNVPLSDTQIYCYRVMTRGAYGNPFIKEPLENFSQIVCAQPNDTIPPCKPLLSIQLTDCEEFFATQPCDVSSFVNKLSWVRPSDDECAADIQGYKIYRSSSVDGVYVWLDNAGVGGIVRDTFFIDDGENHIGLPSLAFCYKISAIDRSGNESDLSDASCNDNCPYYELPNVFSPNDGNECNDRFSAWRMPNSYIKSIDENGTIDWGPCGAVDVTKCARFVESVVFSVYNRWGKEIYSYESGSERSIYIDWDGRDNDGRELAAGIYYYAAQVTFDSVDPKKANQTIKGWVHLIR